ncbi:MAG: 6,7-dimethyl-8-ribityllumazine synthase [Balneolaceae bacterium]|nr:6,7-dimethyl-8-ribityllumazine synthase [Balneolaceae bacterium]
MSITELEGDTEDRGWRIGIAVARWNSFVTDKLLEGALEALRDCGVSDDRIVVAHCPGSYELPLTARRLLAHTDGVLALGAVIRGETSHFDYVCDAANRGVLKLNMEEDKPVTFGVLTTDTVEQAQERSGQRGEKGNKGAEAAWSLLEMLSLLDNIDEL